ncbi:hypothetical protein JYB64_02640 [Algoriphagus aestuarii]|nr:hypothetical protein [Algoriphagus aestuarii]
MKSTFPFKKIGFSVLALVGMCLFAGESLAQTEQEKVDLENVKPLDKPISDEINQNLDSGLPKVLNTKALPAQSNKVAVKRDLPAGGIDKDAKKDETAPSTLSFNIFLYIVDKFKAD